MEGLVFAVVAKIVGFAAGWCAALPCKAGASTVSSDPGGDPPTAVSIAPASTLPVRVRIGAFPGGRRVRGPEPGKQRRHQQQLPDVTAGACASAAAATSTAAAVATNNNSGGAD